MCSSLQAVQLCCDTADRVVCILELINISTAEKCGINSQVEVY